jgi:hypothetical protein
MISWKIYMILEFYFDLVGFKEQMKKYINILNLSWLIIIDGTKQHLT